MAASYLDSSVLLRKLLGEPNPLRNPPSETYVSSQLIQVECLRTLDRLRLRHKIDDQERAWRTEQLYRALERLELIEVTNHVLERASHPFPTPIGTLDAIHLASLLMWKEHRGETLTLLTHDIEMGLAARSLGFPTLGDQ